MSQNLPKLHAFVGTVVSVMSKSVHSNKPICDKYSKLPKNHKLQAVVLVEVDVKVVRKGVNAIQFLFFTHSNLLTNNYTPPSDTSM